ncbi:hypothetical protein L9F63_027228, partial [Diploptera punctata]
TIKETHMENVRTCKKTLRKASVLVEKPYGKRPYLKTRWKASVLENQMENENLMENENKMESVPSVLENKMENVRKPYGKHDFTDSTS